MPKHEVNSKADEGWVLPTRQEFTDFIVSALAPAMGKPKAQDAGMTLFAHQRVVRDFLQYDSPYRGCLIYHGVGTGKTCSSVAAFEASLVQHMKIVIMTPASLKNNYIREIRRCGNELYSRLQRWVLVSADDETKFVQACTRLGLDPKRMKRKYAGVYDADANGKALDEFPADVVQIISTQIEEMIQAKYEFIHYNGVSIANLDAMIDDNPLSGKAVIIDEVHNVISMAVGNGARGKRLYQLLVEAQGAKIIALSATPLVNYPHELSYLIGMIKGYDPLFKITCVEPPPLKTVYDVLLNDKHIDRVEIDGRVIRFTTLPAGFMWTDVKKREKVIRSNEAAGDVEQKSRKALIQSGIQLLPGAEAKKGRDYVMPLPLDEGTFNATFIDQDTGSLLHTGTLMKRLTGSISYFNAYDPEVYPKLNETRIVTLDMSSRQWEAYDAVRAKERQLERRAKNMAQMRKQSNSIFRDSTNVYRAFSRAVCNFAFPSNVERPWPSSVRTLLKREGGTDGDEEVSEVEAKNANMDADDVYAKAIDDVMQVLRTRAGELLVKDGLKEHSPKFAMVIDEVSKCPGPALVYSQFRSVEGLGVLSIALQANGYAEMKLKRHAPSGEWEIDVKESDYGLPKFFQLTSDKEQNKILLSLFNSEFEDLPPRIQSMLPKLDTSKKNELNIHGSYVKIIMITAAGAEGLSLRAVRQVHILEPYWNSVRTDQVIGRAVRAHSHTQLPRDERQVDVFIYVMRFLESQMSLTIRKQDDGKTSDQAILDVAGRKHKIMSSIMDVMHSAAYDCLLHIDVHAKENTDLKCYSTRDSLVSHFDVERDVAYEDETKASRSTLKIIVYRGKRYAYDDGDGQIFDLDAYQSNGRRIRVGVVKQGKVEMIR